LLVDDLQLRGCLQPGSIGLCQVALVVESGLDPLAQQSHHLTVPLLHAHRDRMLRQQARQCHITAGDLRRQPGTCQGRIGLGCACLPQRRGLVDGQLAEQIRAP
jgi:hypothetical protein